MAAHAPGYYIVLESKRLLFVRVLRTANVNQQSLSSGSDPINSQCCLAPVVIMSSRLLCVNTSTHIRYPEMSIFKYIYIYVFMYRYTHSI